MGEIGAEELMNWEKQHNMGNGTEEKILVLVRLRPLSEKETARSEVVDWECINSSTILYRNSLQERSGLPTAYSFDRVFRGDCSTREVYEEGTKDIVLSVVGGINSTIFAYGQTSSGKTYTMNGITEYAVADIYEYMQRHEEREFALKFSAMEIYNEVVRDLLSTDNTPLRLLDDIERGTIIERLTEETLRDRNHLKQLLSICEAQRKIGETSLNETSSRSHQILRLTIESSAREFIGKGNSTTLAASVNFVDLAGSERASQALSGGQRLKEGCHINRSLLTLGTVIRKLSKGRHGHVNYRDSKLTRILQPALGGNARTAIICTLSPARSHIEQSRNTLLFAICAKEVSTNAQVNVVMSDKALVKHLQKEVARLESELRNAGSMCDHATLLRKKDMQIEKLEKEVNELTKQLNLADSRIEGLMRSAEIDKNVKKLNEIQFVNGEVTCNGKSDLLFSDFSEDHYSSNDVYDKNRGTDEPPIGIEEDCVDICKEVRCINYGCSYDILEKKHSISSKLRRTKSCRANFTTSSSDFEMAEQGGNTPPTVLEKNIIGRLEGGFVRKHWKLPPVICSENSARLTRNNSLYSDRSSFIDETRSQNCTNGDEDIPTLGSFVSGLRELAKLQVQETGTIDEKNARDVALDTMHNWPLKFENLQKAIIELWQVCNVSLVHRTYFILLIKNDFTDSIYMEVEYRRLSFLNDTFSRGNSAVQEGHTMTLASSKKSLCREREMLIRQMYKRYTEEERNRIYREWGISVNSKQRRLQLVHLLWSDTENLVHVTKSAAIVAKLIGFSEHGLALKEMIGLSFTPPRMGRKSFRWKNSMPSLL